MNVFVGLIFFFFFLLLVLIFVDWLFFYCGMVDFDFLHLMLKISSLLLVLVLVQNLGVYLAKKMNVFYSALVVPLVLLVVVNDLLVVHIVLVSPNLEKD